MTAALLTVHSMSAKMDICMIKVVQLEAVSEDEQIELVQDLKSSLEELNMEKKYLSNILMKNVRRQRKEE